MNIVMSMGIGLVITGVTLVLVGCIILVACMIPWAK